jgi:hypothetical protein
MIVSGCSHDSNCAASTRYMNRNDSMKANRKALPVRAISLLRPNGPAV